MGEENNRNTSTLADNYYNKGFLCLYINIFILLHSYSIQYNIADHPSMFIECFNECFDIPVDIGYLNKFIKLVLHKDDVIDFISVLKSNMYKKLFNIQTP